MAQFDDRLGDDTYVYLPRSLVEHLFLGTKAEYIKVYIFARLLAQKNGGTVTAEQLCEQMGADEKEINGALAYFAECRALCIKADHSACFPSPEGQRAPTVQDCAPAYDTSEIYEQIADNAELGQLFELAQAILGKMLSGSAVRILYGLYDWLGMPPSVILRLLEYCAGMGKRDMRYIEKVAISWHQMGIMTDEMADTYIKAQDKRSRYQNDIRRILGISGRNLAPSEQRHVDLWYQTGIDTELIEMAFDYCVRQTGKLSIAYMNKVLLSWREQGISTAEEAQKNLQAHAAAGRQRSAAAFDSGRSPSGRVNRRELEVFSSGQYDYGEIEGLARKRLKERITKEKKHGI